MITCPACNLATDGYEPDPVLHTCGVDRVSLMRRAIDERKAEIAHLRQRLAAYRELIARLRSNH